jgi:hypothetical protein
MLNDAVLVNSMVQTMGQNPIGFPSSNHFELLLYFRKSVVVSGGIVSGQVFETDIVAHVNLALVP